MNFLIFLSFLGVLAIHKHSKKVEADADHVGVLTLYKHLKKVKAASNPDGEGLVVNKVRLK